MKRALLVGGTGASGPHIARGLLDRGFEVTRFHTGRHEPEESLPVERLHGDPFSAEGIGQAISRREFDIVIATYGRIKLLARAVAGRVGQFLSVGGTLAYQGYISPAKSFPSGLPIGTREDFPMVPPDAMSESRGARAVRRVEDVLFGLHEEGAFSVSVFRFPSLYGPRNPHHWEWSTIRRVLDNRPFIVLPDGGLPLHSRLSARNAAHSILLAVDYPEEAAGQAFNCADDDQYSLRGWVEMTMEFADGALEIVSVPGDIPSPGYGTVVFGYSCTPHAAFDTRKIRRFLNYTDTKPAVACLHETVEWILSNRADAESWSILDPFDYAAEDQFMSVWRNATDQFAH
jgi:nucleoside-diphosphate-sugar epimerase